MVASTKLFKNFDIEVIEGKRSCSELTNPLKLVPSPHQQEIFAFDGAEDVVSNFTG